MAAKGDAVPLAVDQWYDFHEFGCHLGNVGSDDEAEAIQTLGQPRLLGYLAVAFWQHSPG